MTTLVVPRWRRMRGVLTYRGGAGQWAWLLHRLAGVGVVLFLLLHVFDIWLLGLGEEVFQRFLVLYRHPVARVGEVFLIFGVLFHALNGARIILIDLWPGMVRHQRRLVYLEAVLLLLVLIPMAWATLVGFPR